MDTKGLKTVDIIVYALLLIGALNWGLVGLLQFDLVAFIFGAMTPLARIVYVLVGLAAIYDIVFLKAIWKRWNVHY
ncbi:MAG: DUF378 domain-containing protein [Phycisphaerae bacterium]